MAMDRAKYSAIAHSSCDLCNPVGHDKTNQGVTLLGEAAPLERGSTVLDVGAGKGEWLLRLLERFPVHATGIEPAPLFAAEMRRRALVRNVAARLEVRESSAADYVRARGNAAPFDAALCIGALHAFGTLPDTLRGLKALVRPGGALLVGAGYWRKPPDQAYLDSFGGRADEMGTHASNVDAILEAGLNPLWACASTIDEFEEYEWRYSRGIEDYASTHPDDPDVPAMLERSRSWRRAFLRWGRETMGFGLYLARLPNAVA